MTAPAPTPSLEVALVLPSPHLPLILCSTGFMTTLANAEVEAAALTVIKDGVGAQAAATLLQRATKAKTDLNKQRLDLTRPFQAQIDAINAAAKEPDARLDNLKRALSKAQTDFAIEQRRLADEAEAKRKADLRVLELKLAQEKKEAEDKAAAIAEQLKKQAEAVEAARKQAVAADIPIVEEEVWEEEAVAEEIIPEPPQKTETEKAIEAVKFAPAVAVVKPSGVRIITTLVPFVTDVNQLPDIFVDKTAKIAAIRSTFCAGWKDGDSIPVLAGVRFDVQTSTQSTGRNQF